MAHALPAADEEGASLEEGSTPSGLPSGTSSPVVAPGSAGGMLLERAAVAQHVGCAPWLRLAYTY